MLRSITEVFGADMWFSTVLLLTHGGAPPPDTSAGQPMAVEMFYQQRGQQAQNMLRQVAGDQRCGRVCGVLEGLGRAAVGATGGSCGGSLPRSAGGGHTLLRNCGVEHTSSASTSKAD